MGAVIEKHIVVGGKYEFMFVTVNFHTGSVEAMLHYNIGIPGKK